MTKFIEVTHELGDRVFLNLDSIDYIEPNNLRLTKTNSKAKILLKGRKDSWYVQESYEEIKNLINFSKEVSDIMKDN